MKRFLLLPLLLACSVSEPREIICTKYENREADTPCKDAIYSIGNTDHERQECVHPKQQMTVETFNDAWFVRCTCPGRLFTPSVKP